jgi:hypothetical protein
MVLSEFMLVGRYNEASTDSKIINGRLILDQQPRAGLGRMGVAKM